VARGQRLNLMELKPSQHKTQAPNRYTEATLIRAMEKLGIGRPSTYAAIMENIRRRGYIREQKRVFFAEPVGETLTQLLMTHFKDTWMEYQFTAHMEEDLDKVAEGTLNWHALVIRFNTQLENAAKQLPVGVTRRVSQAQRNPQTPPKLLDEKCETCGAALMIRESRHGKFISCSGFPGCRQTKPLPGSERETPCEKCGRPMYRRSGKRGDFFGCSGYPTCRNITDIPPAQQARPSRH